MYVRGVILVSVEYNNINYTNLCAELVSNPRLEWWCVEAKLDTSAEQCVCNIIIILWHLYTCIIMYIIMTVHFETC